MHDLGNDRREVLGLHVDQMSGADDLTNQRPFRRQTLDERRDPIRLGAAAVMSRGDGCLFRGIRGGLIALGECVRLPRPDDHWGAPVEAQQRFEADEGKQPGKGANCLEIESESPWAPHALDTLGHRAVDPLT